MKRSSVYRLLFCYACFSLLFPSCGGPQRVGEVPAPVVEEPFEPIVFTPAERTPVVRVLVTEPASSIRVRISSAFFVGENPTEPPVRRFDSGGDLTIRSAGNRLILKRSGKDLHEAPVITIRKTGEGNTYINGKHYRGDFTFRSTQGGIIAINDIEIDDYLKGVLPAEIGYLREDQFEAYFVQAIASRSYSLSKLEEKRLEMYDMKATIMDQVYRGVQGEHPEASRAVDDTRGTVALFEGMPARMYYSACCGGHTADIRTGWPWKEAFPYLYGGRDTGDGENGKSFCYRSSHFRWRVHWSGRTLENILKKTLPRELGVKSSTVGRLQDIVTQGVGPDGRVETIEIVTDRGSHLVTGDRIRWVLLPSQGSSAILKSTMFKLDVQNAGGKVSAVNLVGGGNGHGIGMCQSGAIRMAEKGYGYDEIISHYYPGVSLVRYYP